MMGPAAAARPLLRPGSTLILKQLSGPATRPRDLSSRGLAGFASFSFNVSLHRPTRQLAICLRCRLQGQGQARTHSRSRHYSTNPPNTPNTADTAASKEQSQQQPPSSSSPPPDDQPEPHRGRTHELPSQTDSRRSALSQNFSHFMDNLQSRVLVASQTLNDLTGYSAIESIKATNARLESDLAQAQENLRHARAHFKAVNARRAATQREVTTLLARKDTWTPLDLERFTTLYRQDHELEAAVAGASTDLTEAEADEARLSQALNSGMLKRYHEEQIWSDRIRRQSTWGTWGLMGVNVLLFLVLQFVAEPWKRNRLMKGIAAEEKAALEAVRKELEDVRGALARRDEAEAEAAAAAATATATAAAAAATTETLVENAGAETAPVASWANETPDAMQAPPRISWKEFLAEPSRWRLALEDLYSERKIDLRMKDASLIALEGAVTGAFVVASVALVLVRRS